MQAVVTKQVTNIESILGAVAAQMDSAGFSSWIAPQKFEIADDTLILFAQNQFSADYIGSVYKNVLSGVAAEYGLGLKICVRNARPVSVANDNNVQKYSPATTATNVGAFDAFVASDENALVLAACKKVASGAVSFSPLFIYGPAGCGKTLLADSVRGAAQGRVVMMSGAMFVSEFARSLADKNVFAFKDYCRNCDTFILDGVQTLSGKHATCNEFVQLVIDLRTAGKNVILTSDVAPNALSGFDRAARSLFASGLVADVTAPNAHVRAVMLMRAGIADDVANTIAANIASDGHLVNGVANKIKMYSEITGVPVDMVTATRLLADTLQNAKTPIQMVHSMCAKLGVSYDVVCGAGRARGIVMARQTMMAVLKGATRLSLAEIGNLIGGRDHATVLYAVRQIEKLKKTDLVLSAQIDDLIAGCK